MLQFNDINEYVYVKLQLITEELDDASRTILEEAGVECLDQGGEYEAYGVVLSNKATLEILNHLPCIKIAALEAPPAGI